MTQVSVCSVILNRPVRTRLQGGVGGGIREDSPYPDSGATFRRGRTRSQLAPIPLTNRSKPFTPGDPPISIGTLATDQSLTKCNRRQLADPAHPPSALVVNAIGDLDTAASDRRDLSGLLRLGQPLTRFMLTLSTTTLWDRFRFGIPELRPTDQRAIAPPPICPLADSLSLDCSRTCSCAAVQHFCILADRVCSVRSNAGFGGNTYGGGGPIATGTSHFHRSLKTNHPRRSTDIDWDLGH